MCKRNFTFILSILFLLSVVNVNVATQDYIPRNVDIDRSRISKNILLGSYTGGISHLKPLLDIGAILTKRGYNVTLLTSGNYTPSSEYPNVKQISLGPPVNVNDILNFTELFHKEFDLTRITQLQTFLLKSYKDAFEKYKSVVEEYNIDLLICYAFANDACLDVARTLKKPVVGFSSFVSSIEPKSYKSDPIFRCNVTLENESFLERFKCTIIQPIRMLYLFYPFANQLNDIRKQINVEPVFMAMRRLPKTTLLLIDTFFGFELPQPLPPNIQEIGPVLSDEYPPLTLELSDFINSHERVVYVSFGARISSSIENNKRILQSLVEAINKNIIDSVVWALVQTSKDTFPSTLTLTDGTQIRTSPILKNEHPHIHITRFAPQFSVLNHANTKLFLSHGGAGSSHESLYTGTPMLILPVVADQMGNAERLRLSGVSLTLSKLKFDVNDVLNKMDFLLKDENVKKNLKRMEFLAKINSKRKYRAADLIEYVLYNAGDNNFSNGVNEEFLKEWIPADTRMGFIRGNNYDVYGTLLSVIFGIVGGILLIMLKLIKFIVKKIPSPKPKRE